ncbi:MAG TPA: nucleotidyl transferase AbiEii/AbiGii toxin family protein [Terriglobales bacterium]|nr:nucleotidyl transferase AbiEii/AbiGii toxin family protein [Terriglobales bacterium]HXF14861.1 nucleotidyl transferase AbiEii/AbiGii toxin family protein [Terriglobales bacterium]
MMYFATMNVQERIEKYLKRGFQQPVAEILVLLEDCASGLFSAFPRRFVLFGGATLVLFYDSPRLSRDLDLLAKAEDLPEVPDLKKIIEASIQSLAETFGLGKLECHADITKKDFIKIWVQSNEKRLFSVDLTSIGGTVLKSDEVQEKLGNSDQIVITPNAKTLLFQKCETFLERRNIKSRDAFDVDVLLSKGAQLDANLKAHLHDFIQMRELDAESIRARIDRVDTKLCTAELRPVLPDALFSSLAKQEFKPLRSSLEIVFADWL